MKNLPDGITVRRCGKTYVIVKNMKEEIGGIVVRGTSTGDTQLEPYVNEPQHKNKKLVALVMQQMTEALIINEAKKPEHLRRDALPPVNIPKGTEVFETKIFPCSKCNKIIAALVFAWESGSPEEMEIIATKFELEASIATYPMWILGAPNCNDDEIAKHLTLQISENKKGKVYWEHPNDMNQRLVELDEKHC
ncbi:MAG: hypothetical protein HRT38_17340 [Alteromonadaceae bacterium]|nr:hypothetical protein [Alteromonadaceae bacterium]